MENGVVFGGHTGFMGVVARRPYGGVDPLVSDGEGGRRPLSYWHIRRCHVTPSKTS